MGDKGWYVPVGHRGLMEWNRDYLEGNGDLGLLMTPSICLSALTLSSRLLLVT